MSEKRAEQARLIELDKQYLELKERDYLLAGQLKVYSDQQGTIGLKVCNIEREMEILERKIADVQKEKTDICTRIAKARIRKGKR